MTEENIDTISSQQSNNIDDSTDNPAALQRTWVLVSSLDENSNGHDLEAIRGKISDLVDTMNSGGKFVWTGPFDDGQGSMTVFNATQDEADRFYQEYGRICSGVLNCYMYNWEVFPLLTLLMPKPKQQQ